MKEFKSVRFKFEKLKNAKCKSNQVFTVQKSIILRSDPLRQQIFAKKKSQTYFKRNTPDENEHIFGKRQNQSTAP